MARGQSCISSRNNSVLPGTILVRFFNSIAARILGISKSPLKTALREASSSKLISMNDSNFSARCLIAVVLPTCRAPRKSNGLRPTLSAHDSKCQSISRFKYMMIFLHSQAKRWHYIINISPYVNREESKSKEINLRPTSNYKDSAHAIKSKSKEPAMLSLCQLEADDSHDDERDGGDAERDAACPAAEKDIQRVHFSSLQPLSLW